MKRVLFTLVLVLVSTQSIFAAVTITSSRAQIEASGMVNPTLAITGAFPWDFTSQSYMSLTGIDEISVTLTLLDGDTDTGEFDVGQLVLELDDLNTGVVLDGFNHAFEITQTVTGTNQAAGLLAALQTDGLLFGNILDLSPDDNYVKVLDGYTATLSLTDNDPAVVPVPSAMLLCSLGVAVTSRLSRRRLLSV